MRKYILLSTLQSTGTWWVIDALRKHPEIGGLSHRENLMALQNDWVLRDDWTDNPHGEALAPEGKVTLLYEHYFPSDKPFDRWYPQSPSEFLMTVLPTLSPLRDPLLCMIRAWHREPPLYPYDWLIDAWIHAARRGDTLGVKFWCMEPFHKGGFLQAVQDVGLPTPPRWVEGLEPQIRINSTPGDCDLREAYQNRDIIVLRKRLATPWRRLQEAEPILRPFLEKRGFKNLMWWS